jgi:hypothetical protein
MALASAAPTSSPQKGPAAQKAEEPSAAAPQKAEPKAPVVTAANEHKITHNEPQKDDDAPHPVTHKKARAADDDRDPPRRRRAASEDRDEPTHRRVVTDDRDEPHHRHIEPKETRAPQRPTKVTVRIASSPAGAQVVRDGQVIGTTPFSEAVARKDEALFYQLVRAGYSPVKIPVVPTQDRQLQFELAPIMLLK